MNSNIDRQAIIDQPLHFIQDRFRNYLTNLQDENATVIIIMFNFYSIDYY